jgi:hypothetical protein
MQYALLIYADEKTRAPEGSPAFQELVAKHMAFGSELGAARIGGAGLKVTALATTVRTTGGNRTVHDGPFAETKEQLGGFYLIDVPDLDAAIAFAKKVPQYRDGAVEIRPLLGGG